MIKDESGAPLKMYRGTTAGDQILGRYRKQEDVGFGYHFTPDRALAEQYATGDAARRGSRPFVHEAHLDIRNPLDATEIVNERDHPEKHALAMKLAGRRRVGMNVDGVHHVYMQSAIDATDPHRAERILREHGHDGVKYEVHLRETRTPGRYVSKHKAVGYVALDKHQIHLLNGGHAGETAKALDYKTVRGPEGHNDAYHYHATNAENADSIAHEGLKTHRPWHGTDQGAWPDGSTEKRSYFGRATNAHQFAPEGRPVLLRVKADAHPFRRESTGDFYSTKVVPPHKLEYLSHDGEREAWRPLTDRAEKALMTRPGHGGFSLDDDIEDQHARFGHLYRGMSEAEYHATVGAGKPIRSNESSCFSGEGTCFARHAMEPLGGGFKHDVNTRGLATAYGYANGGRDDPRKTGKPNYVVEVKDDGKAPDRDGYVKYQGDVPAHRVTRVMKVHAGPNDTLHGHWLERHELHPAYHHAAADGGDTMKSIDLGARPAAPTNLRGVAEVPRLVAPVKVAPPKAKRKKFNFVAFIDFQGIPINVENRLGDTRSGTGPDGKPWSSKMVAGHYGEIARDKLPTLGVDDDPVDVYVGPNAYSPSVVVIHQHDPDTGEYDEDKVMLGYDSVEEAIGAYKRQYDRPGFYVDGDYDAMPIGAFIDWIKNSRNRGRKIVMDTTQKALSLGARPKPAGKKVVTRAADLSQMMDLGNDPERLVGGKADGRKPEDFDPKALAEGTAHEREHTNDERAAMEIAMDHLAEDPRYYEKLRKVEGDDAAKSYEADRDAAERASRIAEEVSKPLPHGTIAMPGREILFHREAAEAHERAAGSANWRPRPEPEKYGPNLELAYHRERAEYHHAEADRRMNAESSVRNARLARDLDRMGNLTGSPSVLQHLYRTEKAIHLGARDEAAKDMDVSDAEAARDHMQAAEFHREAAHAHSYASQSSAGHLTSAARHASRDAHFETQHTAQFKPHQRDDGPEGAEHHSEQALHSGYGNAMDFHLIAATRHEAMARKLGGSAAVMAGGGTGLGGDRVTNARPAFEAAGARKSFDRYHTDDEHDDLLAHAEMTADAFPAHPKAAALRRLMRYHEHAIATATPFHMDRTAHRRDWAGIAGNADRIKKLTDEIRATHGEEKSLGDAEKSLIYVGRKPDERISMPASRDARTLGEAAWNASAKYPHAREAQIVRSSGTSASFGYNNRHVDTHRDIAKLHEAAGDAYAKRYHRNLTDGAASRGEFSMHAGRNRTRALMHYEAARDHNLRAAANERLGADWNRAKEANAIHDKAIADAHEKHAQRLIGLGYGVDGEAEKSLCLGPRQEIVEKSGRYVGEFADLNTYLRNSGLPPHHAERRDEPASYQQLADRARGASAEAHRAAPGIDRTTAHVSAAVAHEVAALKAPTPDLVAMHRATAVDHRRAAR